MSRDKAINRIFLSLIIVGVALIAVRQIRTGGVAPTPPLFDRQVSLDAAIKLAGEQEKYVFALATADWCGPCQSYKRGALADDRIRQWTDDHAIPVYINVDKSQDDARALQVSSVPAVYIVKDQQIVGRIQGDVSAKKLLRWLDEMDALASAE